MKWFKVLGLALPVLVKASAPTDQVQNGDIAQSGYLGTTHNIDPSKLSLWKNGWQVKALSGEKLYANLLIHTPTGTSQELVISVSSSNIVRIINGSSGVVLTQRTLDAPYVSSDSNCNDGNTVGVTGTPIIDAATDTLYFYSKGYFNGLPGPQGPQNGVYKMWALKIPSLASVSGFPVAITGPASNDPTRYFVGGTVMQRPGLATVGDSILGAFGGHCDSMNYTGMLVAVSKTTGTVTNVQAMMASPGAPSPIPTDLQNGVGGKAGIWQGGMGLATDQVANRVIFTTGNGDGPGENGGLTGAPRSGKSPLSSLEQAIVSFGVNPISGVLTLSDWFQPVQYTVLNKGDKDISSSGVSLLDPYFSGGGVNRVAVAGSKAGIIYVMDADNLGGYKNGAGGTDAILQTITFPGLHFYNGIGSYPGEGGWIYLCTSGGNLQAWKMVPDANGRPNFQFAAKTAITYGCKGTPTITSLDGQPGNAVVWMADNLKGVVAFKAVPTSAVLEPIVIPGTGGLEKFQRPQFGNNRIYVITSSAIKTVGGNPVAAPMVN